MVLLFATEKFLLWLLRDLYVRSLIIEIGKYHFSHVLNIRSSYQFVHISSFNSMEI